MKRVLLIVLVCLLIGIVFASGEPCFVLNAQQEINTPNECILEVCLEGEEEILFWTDVGESTCNPPGTQRCENNRLQYCGTECTRRWETVYLCSNFPNNEQCWGTNCANTNLDFPLEISGITYCIHNTIYEKVCNLLGSCKSHYQSACIEGYSCYETDQTQCYPDKCGECTIGEKTCLPDGSSAICLTTNVQQWPSRNYSQCPSWQKTACKNTCSLGECIPDEAIIDFSASSNNGEIVYSISCKLDGIPITIKLKDSEEKLIQIISGTCNKLPKDIIINTTNLESNENYILDTNLPGGETKRTFFTYKGKSQPINIPDNNFVLVFLSITIILAILLKGSNKKIRK